MRNLASRLSLALLLATVGLVPPVAAREDAVTVTLAKGADPAPLAAAQALAGTITVGRPDARRYKIRVPKPQRLADYAELFLFVAGVEDVSPYPPHRPTILPHVYVRTERERTQREEVVDEVRPSGTPSPATRRSTTRDETRTALDQAVPVPLDAPEVFATLRDDAGWLERAGPAFGFKYVARQGRVYRLRVPARMDAAAAARILSLLPSVAHAEPSYGR